MAKGRGAYMNVAEVHELFVRAAEIDRRLPIFVRPATLKSMNLPFVASFEDRLWWEPADMAGGEIIRDSKGRVLSEAMRKKLKKVLGDQLEFGDKGRRAIEADQFWNGSRVTPDEVAIWERANDLVRLVPVENQRRALLHWAIAIAGGRPFARWCRDEGILRETGRWRKEKALKAINAKLSCVSGVSKREIHHFDDLPNRAEKDDIPVNISDPRREFKWAAEGARPLVCDIDRDLQEFSWAEEQNARRRAREKRKAA